MDVNIDQQKPKLKRNEDLILRIEKMAFGGRGIAKVETEKGSLVVFVPNTLPGQVVKCRIAKVRKNYVQTKLFEVLEPSPNEKEIPYQRIPGAPYAGLPVEVQQDYKKETCIDLIARVGKVDDAANKFDRFISSPTHWHYRNKMEYSFAAIRYDFESKGDKDEFALGFKHRGTWWMVENLDADSGLFDAEVENNLKRIREFCENSGLPPWHAPRREGFYRFLTVRKSYSGNKVLFNLVTTSTGLEDFDLEGFKNLMIELFGDRLVGILHTINDDKGERAQPLDGSSKLIYGKDHITEKMHGLDFDIRMESFFQTNPLCAQLLYSQALSYLDEFPKENPVIFDLFCGTGTIAQLMGREFPNAEIIGVDIVNQAISDAKKAAKNNGLGNVRFYAADVGKFLREQPQYAGKIDAVVLDPPRGGIAPKALKRVIGLSANEIVYISCNPATLARDTETLQLSGYELIKYSLVDQFPHTSHIEAVALFKKTA